MTKPRARVAGAERAMGADYPQSRGFRSAASFLAARAWKATWREAWGEVDLDLDLEVET